jgi:hypothetical protein
MAETYTTGTIFKHYKGNLYEFLYIAHHSETREELVVYKALYGEYGIWVRPKKMFFERIMVDGTEVGRFEETS